MSFVHRRHVLVVFCINTHFIQHIVQHLTLSDPQVPHSAVALGVIHCEVAPSHMLYAANGSLVGLCCLAEKVVSTGGPVLLSQSPICPCVGFGTYAGTPKYGCLNQYLR